MLARRRWKQSGGWHTPVNDKAEIARIDAKLRYDWIEQLRNTQGPTLLVALTRNLFFVCPEHLADEVTRTAARFRKRLPGRKMISAILLHEEPFLPPAAPILHIDQGWRFALDATEGRLRSAMLIENPSPRPGATLMPEEIDALIGPSACW